jgi:uncharacterized membrane protein
MLIFLVFGAVGLVLAVLGAVVRFRRAWWLINGINTASEERRAKMDLDAICVWAGTSVMAGGALFIVGGVLSWLVSEMVLAVVIPVFLILLLGTILSVRKFDGNNFDEAGRETGKSKAKTLGIAALVLLPLIIILAAMIPGFADPAVTIEGGSLTIGGMYGITIARSDAASAELVNELPALMRTGGFGTGTRLIGRVRGPAGAGRAYLRLSNPPYIRDPDGTRELHRQIAAWLR